MPKKYQGTFEIVDEHTQQVMAVCDLTGKAVFSRLVIMDHHGKDWTMTPNRKIMPSRWSVTDPAQNIAMQFDQKILGKAIKPLSKVALALLDNEGREVYRLVDPRTNIPDRIIGAGPSDWLLMDGDNPVAKLTWLPRQIEPAKGLLSRLSKLLTTPDYGIVSAGESHVLAAPVALAMILLFIELTDVSCG
jgi:hypothetical protein